MSDRIPEMSRSEEFPYCIWHPDVPTRETCRELVRRYLQMKYHVGRVCAVAGYSDLFLELDILPEVHIAEEARDNGSTTIFDAKMINPVKSAVMNDCFRKIEDIPRVGNLNGDTAVRSSLDIKQEFKRPVTSSNPFLRDYSHHEGYFQYYRRLRSR